MPSVSAITLRAALCASSNGRNAPGLLADADLDIHLATEGEGRVRFEQDCALQWLHTIFPEQSQATLR